MREAKKARLVNNITRGISSSQQERGNFKKHRIFLER